ncbi:hypothetical protein VTK26DRAFT_1208 [Humicola hyalothermophila]
MKLGNTRKRQASRCQGKVLDPQSYLSGTHSFVWHRHGDRGADLSRVLPPYNERRDKLQGPKERSKPENSQDAACYFMETSRHSRMPIPLGTRVPSATADVSREAVGEARWGLFDRLKINGQERLTGCVLFCVHGGMSKVAGGRHYTSMECLDENAFSVFGNMRSPASARPEVSGLADAWGTRTSCFQATARHSQRQFPTTTQDGWNLSTNHRRSYLIR